MIPGMLLQILTLIVETATSLVGGACLVRLYMQHQRIPFANPAGRFVFAATDWIVVPLRRIVPAIGRWDTASLLAAWLLKLVQVVVLGVLTGGVRNVAVWPVLAMVHLAALACLSLTVLLILHAVLSWLQPGSPAESLLRRLTAPILLPLQRVVPSVGGVDLAPLVGVLILQIASMVLDAVRQSLLP